MLRRLGRDGRQLRRARADGPQARLHAGHDEPAQKHIFVRYNVVCRRRTQIHGHAGQGIVRRCRSGIGDAVPAHLGRLVHGEGQPGVQRVIHDQCLAPGQPLAGGGQHAGQPRHDAAHNNALTGGGVHRQAPQQKFHLGGVLVLGAAGAGDHAGRERNGAVVRPVQPANADVGVADVNC